MILNLVNPIRELISQWGQWDLNPYIKWDHLLFEYLAIFWLIIDFELWVKMPVLILKKLLSNLPYTIYLYHIMFLLVCLIVYQFLFSFNHSTLPPCIFQQIRGSYSTYLNISLLAVHKSIFFILYLKQIAYFL